MSCKGFGIKFQSLWLPMLGCVCFYRGCLCLSRIFKLDELCIYLSLSLCRWTFVRQTCFCTTVYNLCRWQEESLNTLSGNRFRTESVNVENEYEGISYRALWMHLRNAIKNIFYFTKVVMGLFPHDIFTHMDIKLRHWYSNVLRFAAPLGNDSLPDDIWAVKIKISKPTLISLGSKEIYYAKGQQHMKFITDQGQTNSDSSLMK